MSENLERVVKNVELAEVDNSVTTEAAAVDENIELINNVEVELKVKIGEITTTIKELYDMKEGGVLRTNALTTDPIDILLDDKVVMQGELVVVDDSYGIKILNIKQNNK